MRYDKPINQDTMQKVIKWEISIVCTATTAFVNRHNKCPSRHSQGLPPHLPVDILGTMGRSVVDLVRDLLDLIVRLTGVDYIQKEHSLLYCPHKR